MCRISKECIGIWNVRFDEIELVRDIKEYILEICKMIFYVYSAISYNLIGLWEMKSSI